jgi:hypothetical protein
LVTIAGKISSSIISLLFKDTAKVREVGLKITLLNGAFGLLVELTRECSRYVG